MNGKQQRSPYIKETPGVCGGYPCVGDTRIPVRLVVALFRERGDDTLVRDWYPYLQPEQIRGAVEYYAAFPERVDQDFARHARAEAQDVLRAR